MTGIQKLLLHLMIIIVTFKVISEIVHRSKNKKMKFYKKKMAFFSFGMCGRGIKKNSRFFKEHLLDEYILQIISK